jgi:two-component system LytT family response regulator
VQLRTLIVDDEALARARLRSLLEGSPDTSVAGECVNGREAVDAIRRLRPSLVFLDVQMPELDGFAALEALEIGERPGVVFVTAFDRYAIRAFDMHAIDYLLKPYPDERFAAALERARGRLAADMPGEQSGLTALLAAVRSRDDETERIAVRSREGVQFVDVAELDWLAGEGNYTRLYFAGASVRTRETLSELETRLAPVGFLRVHRSAIVNTKRIFRIESWSQGEYLIVLRNGQKINSGRVYAEQVRRLYR